MKKDLMNLVDIYNKGNVFGGKGLEDEHLEELASHYFNSLPGEKYGGVSGDIKDTFYSFLKDVNGIRRELGNPSVPAVGMGSVFVSMAVFFIPSFLD